MLWAIVVVVEAASGLLTWDDSFSRADVAELWALNRSVAGRHHHRGAVSQCASLDSFAPRRSPLAVASTTTDTAERFAWFMSIAKPDDAMSRTYVDFAKAATTSAKLNAPSLAPYFLYTFLPHQDVSGPDDELAAWLKRAGTRVIRWRLSFWDDIPAKVSTSRQGHINVGAFGRLDVPLVVATVLRNELRARRLSQDYVLYTDADVMFARDWPPRSRLFRCVDCARGWPHPKCCRHPLGKSDPEVFMAGTEVFAIWGLNSGIMFMNVPRMLADRDRLIAHANANNWNFLMYDQGLLESFYRKLPENRTTASAFRRRGNHAWDSFDDALYNARGFMTAAVSRENDASPVVWHWHGFKPYDVDCWLDQLVAGRWNLDIDIKSLVRDSKTQGCRGLLNPRMLLPDCSLHLYLMLFAQYVRLLRVAAAMYSAPRGGDDTASSSSLEQ